MLSHTPSGNRFGRSDNLRVHSVTMGHAILLTILLHFVVLADFVNSSPRRSVEKGQAEARLSGSGPQHDSSQDQVTEEMDSIKHITGSLRTKSYLDEKRTLNVDNTTDSTKSTSVNKTEDYTPIVTLIDLDVNNDTNLNSTESELAYNDSIGKRTKPGVIVPAHTNPLTAADLMKLQEQEHIENIKRRVLEKLRLDAPPKLHGPRPALPFKYLHHQYMSDGLDTRRRQRTHPNFYSRKKQVLVMGSDVTSECMNKKGTGCYHFDVEGKVNPKDVFSAEIWIYKLFHHQDPHIQTFIMSELKQDQKGRRRPKNMVNRLETRIKYGWLKIGVKKSVIRWLQKPRQNDGISILCRSCIRKNPRTIYSFKNDTRPFLVITTKKGNHFRHGRSTPRECTESSTECCMKPLTINFQDIGWDSIVSPVSFQANYCYGSCEAQHQAHYNHTQMIQDHRWNQNEWNMMRQLTPCCAPISYSSLSIMYVDNNDLQVHFVPNLVATACGCV
ncbi:growth/differentiation factor 8-like [Pecten maximus]|uniref:growth/differentiation factor 8-like n=1 Tax=Pecten maximus TaxID=6579 RepID=UPI0014588E56|nr:growth/differentiation factor 8-like [Pecten maximus]